MVGKRCVVWDCDNTSRKKNIHVSFDSFSCHALRNEYIKEINRNVVFKEDFRDGDELLERNCICGEHFTAENYRMHELELVELVKS